MTRDEPIGTVPAIGVAVPAAHYRARLRERERVETSIHGSVAINLDESLVDLSGGPILEEVMKVIFSFGRRQPWFVRNGGQEDGAFRIVGHELVWIARLQGLVPSVEQRCDQPSRSNGRMAAGVPCCLHRPDRPWEQRHRTVRRVVDWHRRQI